MDLRFHVLSAQWIPLDVRHKILERVLFLGFACTNFCLEQNFFFVVEIILNYLLIISFHINVFFI